MNGTPINNFLYADDTIFYKEYGLQILNHHVASAFEIDGMKFNIRKTKFRSIIEESNVKEQFNINGELLERLHNFFLNENCR